MSIKFLNLDKTLVRATDTIQKSRPDGAGLDFPVGLSEGLTGVNLASSIVSPGTTVRVVTENGENYVILQYNASNTLVTSFDIGQAEILVLAGGGGSGGGQDSGTGSSGAGGAVYGNTYMYSGEYNVIVGGGGGGGSGAPGSQGGNSQITFTSSQLGNVYEVFAEGGGGGGGGPRGNAPNAFARPGGSGGGGGGFGLSANGGISVQGTYPSIGLNGFGHAGAQGVWGTGDSGGGGFLTEGWRGDGNPAWWPATPGASPLEKTYGVTRPTNVQSPITNNGVGGLSRVLNINGGVSHYGHGGNAGARKNSIPENPAPVQLGGGGYRYGPPGGIVNSGAVARKGGGAHPGNAPEPAAGFGFGGGSGTVIIKFKANQISYQG